MNKKDWLDDLLANHPVPLWPQDGKNQGEKPMDGDKKTGVIDRLTSFVKGGQAAQVATDGAIAKATATTATNGTGGAEKKTPKATRKPRKAAGGLKLAPIIDEYLIKGGHTAGEIAKFVEVKALAGGMDTKGKDLKANVRARMIHHRKKGATVVRSKDGDIKVTPAPSA